MLKKLDQTSESANVFTQSAKLENNALSSPAKQIDQDAAELQSSPIKRHLSKQIKQEHLPPPVLVPDSANISCFPDSLAKISPEIASEDKSQRSQAQQKKEIQLERMEMTNQNRIETDSLQH